MGINTVYSMWQCMFHFSGMMKISKLERRLSKAQVGYLHPIQLYSVCYWSRKMSVQYVDNVLKFQPLYTKMANREVVVGTVEDMFVSSQDIRRWRSAIINSNAQQCWMTKHKGLFSGYLVVSSPKSALIACQAHYPNLFSTGTIWAFFVIQKP